LPLTLFATPIAGKQQYKTGRTVNQGKQGSLKKKIIELRLFTPTPVANPTRGLKYQQKNRI
jgi:hypothetical protein